MASFTANFDDMSTTMRYKKDDGTWDDNTMVETALLNSEGQQVGFFAFDIKSTKYEFSVFDLNKQPFSGQ